MNRPGLLFLIFGVAVLMSSCSGDEPLDEPLSSEKKIISFRLTKANNETLSVDVEATIDESAKTINLALPFYVPTTNLKPTILISPNAIISPASNESQSF